MLRIAVLGCGRIGRMHAKNVASHPRMRLASVYDINAQAAGEVAARLGVAAVASADEIFASPDIDGILIATATDTHTDYIERAVEAGKAILCEKPIDLDLGRVDQCAERIRGTKVPIMIGFVRRFDPGHRACRKAIRDGAIGDLHQVVITSRDPGMAPVAYIEASGGIFRDMTIHDFDMARYMLGEEPVEVSAMGSRLVDPALMNRTGDWDTVVVALRTATGKQALITNSRQAVYGYDQRVEALGSAGMVTSENRRPHEARLFAKTFTGRAEPYLDFFIERYVEAFNAELDAFANAIESGKPPEVAFEDGRLSLVLAEAAMRSVSEGRVVRTSEII